MHYSAYLKQLRTIVTKYNITEPSRFRTLVNTPEEMKQFYEENKVPDVSSASIAYTLGYYQISKVVRMSGKCKRINSYVPVYDIHNLN